MDQNPAGPNLEICGIRADGMRMTDDHVTMKTEPRGKCHTKKGGYECQTGAYGMTDDEPYPSSYTDCTYSQWRVNEGTTLFTIKSSEKVDEFEFDYFRPQYQPGWKIKENGVEISTTSPGPKEAWPAPYTVAHAILSPPEPKEYLNDLPRARYVYIERPSKPYPHNIINLAEFEVFDVAGKNVALNSAVTGGPGHAHGFYGNHYGKLTDGITHTSRSCAHTTGSGLAYLKIDLGAVKEIAKLVVWNRVDCCQDRIIDAKVSLLDEEGVSVDVTPVIKVESMKMTYDLSAETPSWEYSDT